MESVLLKIECLIFLFVLPFVFSFKFSPMTQTIDAGNGESKAKFEIENNTAEPIPVVISVVERIQLPDGSEKLPAAKNLKAFPPQLIVPPKDKRSVRIDWSGGKDFKREKSFRVIAEQVPLNLNKNGKESAGIKMLLRYQAALYVDPGQTRPDLVVSDFSLGKELKITLENKGSAHQYLNGVRIKFVKGDKVLNVDPSDLKKMEGQNVLANSKRLFRLRAPKGLNKDFKGIIEFDNK